MSDTFKDLLEAFNAAARKFPGTSDKADLLLTRYELLLKYKAEDNEQKAQLVEKLYDCGLQMVKRYAMPNADRWIYSDFGANLKAMMGALSDPASLPYIPKRAPGELADTAFSLLTRAESLEKERFSSATQQETFQASLISFARTALDAANLFRAALEGRTIDIKTSKVITPARKLILKAKDDQPPAP